MYIVLDTEIYLAQNPNFPTPRSEQGKSPQTESFAEMKSLKIEDKSICYVEKQYFK